MVPFRVIAEALGVEVTWQAESRTVVARGQDRVVKLTIDQPLMWVDGAPALLDVPPMIVNDRTLVPLRAFSTAFKAEVDWVGATRTVVIKSPIRPMRTLAFYAIRSYHEREFVPRFSDVAYGWATLSGDGRVDLAGGEYRWPQPDGDVTGERLLADAAEAGTRRHLMIQAVDGNIDLAGLVQNEELIARVAREVSAVVKEKGFDGVVIDLESLAPRDADAALKQRVRQGFTRLVAAVAQEMRADGKETIVSVHPLNGWYEGYDYKALAAEADLLQVMAHDYVQDGNPEPADKVEEAIRLAIEQVGAEQRGKLLVAIVAPYETSGTMLQKVGLAKRYSLGGISVWRLGELKAEGIEALETTVTPVK